MQELTSIFTPFLSLVNYLMRCSTPVLAFMPRLKIPAVKLHDTVLAFPKEDDPKAYYPVKVLET